MESQRSEDKRDIYMAFELLQNSKGHEIWFTQMVIKENHKQLINFVNLGREIALNRWRQTIYALELLLVQLLK